MFNPLIQDFSNLKDTELEERMTDLNKKYMIALRTGNSSLAQQVAVAIESFREETQRRQREASKKLLERQSKDLDGLINIG